MATFMSWYNTHVFLLDAKPTTTAAALTGEITAVNRVGGGSPTANVVSNYHIDGSGFADKTVTTQDVDPIEINYDRAAGSVYSPTGTDQYSKFRSWQESNIAAHKYLVEVYKRDPANTYWEGVCYDVINAGRTEEEKGPDSIQSVTQRLEVSGPPINVVITESSGTFTCALPASSQE